MILLHCQHQDKKHAHPLLLKFDSVLNTNNNSGRLLEVLFKSPKSFVMNSVTQDQKNKNMNVTIFVFHTHTHSYMSMCVHTHTHTHTHIHTHTHTHTHLKSGQHQN